jgi:hypothetical protein
MNVRLGHRARWIAAALLSMAIPAAADDTASFKKEMLAIFDKSVKQFKARDIKGFMTMFTDDYTGKGARGEPQTKATFEREMKAAMDSTRATNRADLRIDKLSVKGSTAELESTMTLDLTIVDTEGGMGPKGKVHNMLEVEKSRETWVKTKDGWKVKKGEVLPGGKMLMDGKPFPPPPGSGKTSSKK